MKSQQLRKKLIITIATFLTLLPNVQPALAHDFGRLTGKVTDDRERPIDGTHVVVTGRKAKYEVVTDNQGDYGVRLHPGTYRVLVKARPGFASKRTKVQITTGKTTSLSMTPKSVIYYNNCDKGLLRP